MRTLKTWEISKVVDKMVITMYVFHKSQHKLMVIFDDDSEIGE